MFKKKLIYPIVLLFVSLQLNCSDNPTSVKYNKSYSELESVWQYLKVYSIHQDRISDSPFDYSSPEVLLHSIADTLYNSSYYYTRYLNKAFSRYAAKSRQSNSTEVVNFKKISDSTCYISISVFDENTFLQFLNILPSIAPYKKIVVDISNNPGGDLQQLDSILECFLPANVPYIKAKWREYDPDSRTVEIHDEWESLLTKRRARSELIGKKIAVIINENSASASEIMAAALKDGASAYLVGKKSFGKGIGQIKIPRKDRDTLLISFIQFRGVSERIGEYHLIGIEPDIEAEPDQQVATAVKYLEPSFNVSQIVTGKKISTPQSVSFNPSGYVIIDEDSLLLSK